MAHLAHRGSSTGDSRLMERVRFLRAGLVTPLPGGLGIDPAGIMTGARGASLQARAMAKVTPLPAVSREARPGLSHGINLRGKRRGGAPRGERACARRAAAPAGAANGWCACRRSASPLLWGGKNQTKLGRESAARTRSLIVTRESRGGTTPTGPARSGRPDDRLREAI